MPTDPRFFLHVTTVNTYFFVWPNIKKWFPTLHLEITITTGGFVTCKYNLWWFTD